MTGNFCKWALVFALLFNAPTAYSQGWYVGLAVGSSTYDLPGDLESFYGELREAANDLNSFPGIDASFDFEDGDTAIKIFAGQDIISPYLGVEFGYVDLGKTTADFSFSSDGNSFPPGETAVSSVISVDGLNAGIVGSLPVSDSVVLNGRMGVYHWDAEVNFRVEDTTGTFLNESYSESDDGNDLYYGVGLDIGWVSLFYEIYDLDGDDVDLAGLGIKYRF